MLFGLRIRFIAGAALAVLALAFWAMHSRYSPEYAADLRRLTSPARRPATPPVPTLQVEDHVVRGHIVEIKGRSDTNATVMINGEPAPLIFDHSSFKHFVLVPEGGSVITITAMNDAGGVNTKQLQVQVP
jgi:hypothetical protein